MKIDLVIHSSDSNPFYLEFWPLVSKVWKLKFNIEPLLVFIGDESTPIDETYGKVIRMKPIDNVPLYLQCQWVRFWIPSQFPDKVCLTSDIDMFPLSKRYFVDQLEAISDSKYVHLNYQKPTLPVCYHAAKGYLFKQVLNLDDDWETCMRNFNALNLGHDCSVKDPNNPILQNKPNWGAEEEYVTQKISSYNDQSLFVFLNRTHERLDRSYWVWSLNDIHTDRFADSHSIRPYSQYKGYIDNLLDTIIPK